MSARADWLVTGASGFLGRHVLDALDPGDSIVAVSRRPWTVACQTEIGDLTDERRTAEIVERWQPRRVLHLAGTVKPEGNDLVASNVLTTSRLLDAVVRVSPDCVVVYASSSAVYGRSSRLGTTEAAPLYPVTPYGESKVAQEAIASELSDTYGTRVIGARLFNLIGRGQPTSLVLANAAQQIAKAERGASGDVRLGPLAAIRDFVDVRDAARAIVGLASSAAPSQPYNVGSGTPTRISDAVAKLCELAKVPITVHSTPSIAPETDVSEQTASIERIQHTIGWSPEIEFGVSLADLLDSFRRQVEEDTR